MRKFLATVGHKIQLTMILDLGLTSPLGDCSGTLTFK